MCGDADDACEALLAALDGMPVRPDRTEEIARLRADYFAEIDHLRPQLDFLAAIRDVLPDDGIFVEDVTQIGFAAHLAFDFRQPRTFQSTGPAGTLGAGYAQGVGAQVALEREGRGRKALVVAGDGGFLFTGNELATAVQHEIPLVCCLFDDGAFGNVKRIQQQRFGDERTIVSTLRNPDFVAYARAFGALGLHADGPDELRPRLDEAFTADVPALVHVSDRTDARSVAVVPPGAGAWRAAPAFLTRPEPAAHHRGPVGAGDPSAASPPEADTADASPSGISRTPERANHA